MEKVICGWSYDASTCQHKLYNCGDCIATIDKEYVTKERDEMYTKLSQAACQHAIEQLWKVENED